MNDFRHMWDFVVIDGVNFSNCNRIHPLMQKNVQRVLSTLKTDPNIQKVIVFGSSLEFRCSSQSDLDLYIEKKNAQQPFLQEPEADCTLDIVTNLPSESRLYQEICRKGLLVWENKNV